MKKINGMTTNVGLTLIIVLVVVGLFSLTTVFAASESGLLDRRINVEATARLIRLQNRQEQLKTAVAQDVDRLEIQIEQARQSMETLQQSVKTQTTQQASQFAALQQQVVDKQAIVQKLEANLIGVRQNIKSDEETFNQDMIALKANSEQAKSELLSEIQAIDIQLSAVQSRLDALPTATPSPVAINNDDTQPDSSNNTHESSSDDEDDDDEDDKSESDDDKDDDKHEDEDDDKDDDDKDDDKEDKSEEKKEDDS